MDELGLMTDLDTDVLEIPEDIDPRQELSEAEQGLDELERSKEIADDLVVFARNHAVSGHGC